MESGAGTKHADAMVDFMLVRLVERYYVRPCTGMSTCLVRRVQHSNCTSGNLDGVVVKRHSSSDDVMCLVKGGFVTVTEEG